MKIDKIKVVKVVRCEKPTSWYHDKIGDTYLVTYHTGSEYNVLNMHDRPFPAINIIEYLNKSGFILRISDCEDIEF